ncbi:DUF6431 domain-containing protein [Carboxydochorda subterranea]|uniref:DUF6431 domain-containing protein n=1 Tax=Carboxydichorda subterranea TaxID=3109565 RepID=A0ABZ1BV19_9FIRM|nr:DUF6431 domain-containing protein [Limnochorda sp. L945t]WRP16607.1 DUF6431 domain-containing protein [Limnochorda sp. L945t]
MISIFAGRDVRSYLAAEEAGRLRLPRLCPACGGRLWGHGCYPRGADETGPDGYQRIPVRRRRCSRCSRTVSFLPSFLRPYQSLLSTVRQRLYQGRRRGCRGGRWPSR